MGDFIIGLDTEILLWINSHHAPFWDTVMYIVSGKWVWIPFYMTLLYAIYLSYGFRTMILMGLMTAVAVTAADQLCGSLIRPYFERMRPANPDNPISGMVHIVENYRALQAMAVHTVHYALGNSRMLFAPLFGRSLSRRHICGNVHRVRLRCGRIHTRRICAMGICPLQAHGTRSPQNCRHLQARRTLHPRFADR